MVKNRFHYVGFQIVNKISRQSILGIFKRLIVKLVKLSVDRNQGVMLKKAREIIRAVLQRVP